MSDKKTIPKSIADAAKWRRFAQTVDQARRGFASLSVDELRDLIDKAILHVRKQKTQNFRSRSRK